jgi:hypothetical protein
MEGRDREFGRSKGSEVISEIAYENDAIENSRTSGREEVDADIRKVFHRKRIWGIFLR